MAQALQTANSSYQIWVSCSLLHLAFVAITVAITLQAKDMLTVRTCEMTPR